MALTQEQVQHFQDHGYVIAPDVVTEADLQPVQDAIAAVIDEKARKSYEAGRMTDLHEDLPFERRIALLHKQDATIIDAMDIMQTKLKAMWDFMRCDNLLDAAASLVGPAVLLNPIQHLRAKMPDENKVTTHGLAGSVPWHQDVGVMWEEADDSNVVTCWMPLIDATEETGCMAILPDVFKRGFLEHEAGPIGTRIRPDLIEGDEPIVAECPRRGAVFMTKYTPHCGLPNVSERVRWTIDLRFQPVGEPTGRPFHPAFVQRNPSDPTSVDDSFEQWCERWDKAFVEARGVPAHRTAAKEKRVWTKGQV